MESKSSTAIYPGTFDPLTSGHVSLIRRGCEIFDHIIVAVANDTYKNTLFSIEERVAMAKEVFKDDPSVTVEPFFGMLVDYVDRRGVKVVLRAVYLLNLYCIPYSFIGLLGLFIDHRFLELLGNFQNFGSRFRVCQFTPQD